jgi:hypothetical protein
MMMIILMVTMMVMMVVGGGGGDNPRLLIAIDEHLNASHAMIMIIRWPLDHSPSCRTS